MLVVRSRLRELHRNPFLFPTRSVALRGEGRKILRRRFFKAGKCDGHALHLRLRLIALTGDVVELATQFREFALHLPHLQRQPLGSGALLGNPGERLLAFGAQACQIRFRLLPGGRRRFFGVTRGGDLAAKLIEF